MHVHGRAPFLRTHREEVTIEHSSYDDMMDQIRYLIDTRIGVQGRLLVQTDPNGQEITRALYELVAPRGKICVTIDNRDTGFVGEKNTDSLVELENVFSKLQERIRVLEKSMK